LIAGVYSNEKAIYYSKIKFNLTIKITIKVILKTKNCGQPYFLYKKQG